MDVVRDGQLSVSQRARGNFLYRAPRGPFLGGGVKAPSDRGLFTMRRNFPISPKYTDFRVSRNRVRPGYYTLLRA